MSETLEQRAERIAADLESRDLEAAEVLRALALRPPTPRRLIEALRPLAGWVLYPDEPDDTSLAVRGTHSRFTVADVKRARAALAEHEPTTPAPLVRGDSRTDDAGRWSGLESGLDR